MVLRVHYKEGIDFLEIQIILDLRTFLIDSPKKYGIVNMS